MSTPVRKLKASSNLSDLASASTARSNLGVDASGANVPLAGGTMTGQLNFSGTTHAGLKLLSLTTTQRDALTPANGMLIYNTTNARVEQYTGGAWVGVIASLTQWTEAGGTYGGQVYTQWTPSSGTNVASVLTPKGTGAFQLQVADGTAAGGDNRGNYAVDLQTWRNYANEVASGNHSFVIGGASKATGVGSVAIGQSSISTGSVSVALGGSHAYGDASLAAAGGIANGNYSTALGTGSNSDLDGKLAVGSFAGAGQRQCGLFVIQASTTDATQTELSWDGSTGQKCVLRNDSTYAFSILVAARRSDANGENDGWEIKGLIHRDANAASTTLDALQLNQIGATAWSVAVDADTTNGSLRVRVTGENAKTIRWCATIYTTEVAES